LVRGVWECLMIWRPFFFGEGLRIVCGAGDSDCSAPSAAGHSTGPLFLAKRERGALVYPAIFVWCLSP